MKRKNYDVEKKNSDSIVVTPFHVFLFVGLAFVCVFCQLLRYQLVDREKSMKEVHGTIERDNVPTYARRGSILDRDGNVLAETVEKKRVFVNINDIRKKDPEKQASYEKRAAEVISRVLKIPESEVLDRIIHHEHVIVYFGDDVHPKAAELISDAARLGSLEAAEGHPTETDKNRKAEDKQIAGLGVESVFVRVHPNDSLAANIVGVVNSKGMSLSGLESKYNVELSGNDGRQNYSLAGGKVIPGSRKIKKDCLDGKDIYLTIDKQIQRIAEEAMKPSIEKYTPESMCAIVMNPYTGEILALANYPTFDLNDPFAVDESVRKNRAVTDTYEPGSTLKTIVAASALEDGCVKPNEIVATCNKYIYVGNRRIECSVHHPYESGHGPVDCYKTIDLSCNAGAIALGNRLGSKKLYKYLTDFGLTGRHNFGFGGEGYFPLEDPNEKDWARIKLANVSFGQGISVTPLQMAAAYCVVANGGYYVEPRIIEGITADKKVPKFSVKGKRRVISEETAKEVRSMLESCVENGTGGSAKIEGRTIGGKTGSAQASVDGRGYSNDYYIASFIGIAPAEKPELVIAVIARRPIGSHFGAAVAAPVLREIADKSLLYMKVPADKKSEESSDGKEST